MDISAIYAITAGGVFAALVFARIISILVKWTDLFSVLVSRHLTIPYFVHRHRLWGPWSRASVILHVTYAAMNIFLILFRITSLTSAGRRAGELALINLVFPLSATHLSYLADLLGIKWRTCCRIHRATGWMTIVLVSFHIIAMIQDQQFSFSLYESQDMFTLIGAASLGILALCSNTWFRRWSFEIFLRGHQILAALFVYGTLRHLSDENAPLNHYLWISLGALGLTSCLQLMILLYRNGLFAGRGAPRALVTFTSKKTNEDKLIVTAARVRVLLPRPVQVEAGQYINIWIPSVSVRSWTQTHPFTVTSWSRHRQDVMELLVQPRHGLSADLTRHALAALESSVSFLALFTGPHGTTEDVSQYESSLLIASGFGLAAVTPYIKKMIYGYNTSTLLVRRLHLILNVSIYVRSGLANDKTTFGEHKRFCLYQGTPDYESIIALEASGDMIERLPNIQQERGRTLVMISAADDLRDHIREIVRGYLHQGVQLSELEYQPNDG
ncbi:ferric reductase family protein [Aspergillus ibericus CBS 121593]|uniref:Cell surface metalloreductase n=1 Tax=Aspergillus ibericus CBS 121593 TaxID=1448316 RepID=A0A395GJ90_9EURO|nr:cell surface metalloreductase [Aspergillus ibericus CBS 121593]RAK94827.1 cell surface metalloreductase [Aspergillus ibericus CBS 121593]